MSTTGAKRILVVEEAGDVLNATCAILESDGYRVLPAGEPDTAVAMAQRESPSVVVARAARAADEQHLLAQLRGEPSTRLIPVILLGPDGDVDRRARALHDGANDYIAWPFQDVEFLARVGVAVRIKTMFDTLRLKGEQLARLSLVDEMTGLYNRRFIQRRLAEELARARRYHLPLSCLMMDLDRFKVVNDTYGHLVGDAVLRQFGHLMRDTVRSVDIVARYGGEEFAIVSPQTGAVGAVTLAERIRQRIARHEFDIGEGRVIGCTLSVGVASCDDPQSIEPEALLTQADEALYRAKQRGRNCVELLSAGTPLLTLDKAA